MRPLDSNEFATEFQRCAGVLWTLAAGVLGDAAQAEDVVQEACIVALQKRADYRRGTSFQAWIGQIVRFVALNQARKLRPRSSEDLQDAVETERPQSSPPPRDPATDPPGARELVELGADQPHFDDSLVRALRSLQPVARACLLLRVVHELEYRELAAYLDIPEGTAMSHVHRSRSSLRKQLLEEREATPQMGDHP